MNSKPLRVEPLYWLAIIIVARFSCGALSNIPVFTILFVFVYILCFIFLFCITQGKIRNREIGMFISLLIYATEVVYITYTQTKNLFNTQAFNSYVLIALFFLYIWLKGEKNRKRRSIITVSITGYAFTFIYSIVKLYQDPLLSRRKAASIVTENSVDTINGVGGFDTVYGALLIICILLFLSSYIPKGKWGMLYWIALFAGNIFVVMATFATSIVLLALIWICWIAKRNKILAGITLFIILLAIIFHEPLGQGIMNFGETITYSKSMSEKVYEIGSMICNGEAAGTLAGDEGRLAKTGWSLKAFQAYPVFGAYGKPDVTIGGHSEIADTLGRFGIVGFVSIVSFFALLYLDTKSRLYSHKAKVCVNTVYCIFVLIGALNPSLYMQIVVPLFIIAPFWEEAMSSRGN